jgi:hypothetical protein
MTASSTRIAFTASRAWPNFLAISSISAGLYFDPDGRDERVAIPAPEQGDDLQTSSWELDLHQSGPCSAC